MTHIEADQSFSAERYYFSQLELGRFTLPKCRVCARLHFFPRLICPHCGSDSLDWAVPSGKGQVYSTTVVRSKTEDYTVCLIDLEEGPRLMSQVVDIAPDAVQIGMPVAARVDRVDGMPLLVFTPVERGQA
ncbi:OB-fold domain-containing protein [Pusillimonas sp. SM2304]|uniref:Zn-ribbon domain-containing OB-fold protein n=1 Tax=Pusillimonas sp. SM2304 TaxID=3073241 RepID=UPI002873F4EC|nr:OB-fold domain-containing protein [Pusillimonas sp. SM2304]MDS1139212.1 OB-fold domain-containing protein [Pusillimonas sp. SM2304]